MGVFNDVFQGIFGGSEKKETSKPVDVTPPELQGLRSPFADSIKTLLGGGSGPMDLGGIPQYGGPLTAEMTPEEQASLSALSVNDPLAVARRAELEKTISGGYLPGQAGANPFLQAATEAATRGNYRQLEEVLSRTLPGRFTQGGQITSPGGSSAFDRAAAGLARDVYQTNSDIAAKMNFEGYNAERGRQMEGIQLGQQEVQTMVTGLQAQALPRLIADKGIERGLAEFQSRITALLQALQITAGTLVNVAQSSKSKGTAQTGIVPAVGSFLGNIKE